jgi:hypothetical protein
MWAIVRRAIVPVLLVIAGIVAIIEGVLYHPIPVFFETETTQTIEIPLVQPSSPPMDDPSAPPGMPGPNGMPMGAPTSIKQKVTRINRTDLVLTEPALTRDITVGGVVRTGMGELKRTYSGKGPALCPT